MSSPWKIEEEHQQRDRWLIYLVVCTGLLILVLVLVTLIYGCQADVGHSQRPTLDRGVVQQTGGHFEQAIGFLNRLDEFESSQVQQQILFHLHQWIGRQAADPDWFADPLFSRLPSRFEVSQHPETLSSLQFQPHDVLVLQEAVWLRDIARTVAARDTREPALREWFSQLADDVGQDAAHDLAVAQRLFDWTVRNIQLEEPQSPAEPAEPARGDDHELGTVAKPGAKRYAWETLLLGRGDWLERSRVFILLARQRGIHVVMLALGEGDDEPEPWLPAVLIGRQLYLCDMKLGVLVPAPEGRGIATLSQVLDDPQLLRQLDVLPEFKYPVRGQDLDSVVALIDATPAHLSQRMSVVESHLTGDQKMILSVSPTPLGKELRKCRGISHVQVTVPYDGFEYRRALSRDPEAAVRLAQEHRVFQGLSPLWQGRVLHFRGALDAQDQRPGAKAQYLMSRTPEKSIQQFAASEDAQQAAGLKHQLPDDPAARAAFIAATQQIMIQVKQHASYWLGLIAFDTGDYDVAIDYFQKRTLRAASQDTNPWTHGARYNLARSHEAIGWRDRDHHRLETARELYLQDDASPQRHGNHWRARQLEPLIAEWKGEPSAS